MAILNSGVVLEEGENLVMEMEAELWATSSNPIARAFGGINKFCAKLLGMSVNGYLVITDRRVMEVKNQKACWCFEVSKSVKYVLPSSIKEIGYEKAATFGCCCPVFNFYYESFTQRTTIQLNTRDDKEAVKIVDAFYNAISYTQK